MITRRDLMLGAAASAALPPVPARATLEIRPIPPDPIPIGTVKHFIKTGMAHYFANVVHYDDVPYHIEERIFDGYEWIPLSSPRGWQLYLEKQYEDDPGRQE